MPSTSFSPLYSLEKLTLAVNARKGPLDTQILAMGTNTEPMTPDQAMTFNYNVSNYNLMAQLAADVQKNIWDTLRSIMSKT